MRKQISKFETETGFELEIKDGKPYYHGTLNLHESKVTTLPDNLVVNGDLNLANSKIEELPDNLLVIGELNLRYTRLYSLPNNLVVMYGLILEYTCITRLPNDLVVGGSLDLSHTEITELPDNFVVGGSLNLEGAEMTELPDNLIVGGYLDISFSRITKLPNNLVVDYIEAFESKVKKVPKDFVLQNFEYDTIIRPNRKNKTAFRMLSWRNGEYIKFQHGFYHVLSYYNNVWEVQDMSGWNTKYIITDGNGRYAYGKTMEQAEERLNEYKTKYKDLTLDSKVTLEDAVKLYGDITGTSEGYIWNFVKKRLIDFSHEYTIADLIEIADGEYGSETFAKYFIDKDKNTTSSTMNC